MTLAKRSNSQLGARARRVLTSKAGSRLRSPLVIRLRDGPAVVGPRHPELIPLAQRPGEDVEVDPRAVTVDGHDTWHPLRERPQHRVPAQQHVADAYRWSAGGSVCRLSGQVTVIIAGPLQPRGPAGAGPVSRHSPTSFIRRSPAGTRASHTALPATAGTPPPPTLCSPPGRIRPTTRVSTVAERDVLTLWIRLCCPVRWGARPAVAGGVWGTACRRGARCAAGRPRGAEPD